MNIPQNIYIDDFESLAKQVSALLNVGGCFLFSQEHPLTTAPIGSAIYTKWTSGIDGESGIIILQTTVEAANDAHTGLSIMLKNTIVPFRISLMLLSQQDSVLNGCWSLFRHTKPLSGILDANGIFTSRISC